MKKIKILFHDAYYDSFEGAQKSLYFLIKNLNKEIFDVVFLTDEKNILYEKFRELNIKIEILNMPKILKSFNKKLLNYNIFFKILIFLFFILPHNIKFLFYLKRNRIDIVHFNSVRSILIKGIASYLLKIPVVLHIRGDYDFSKLIKIICKKLASKIIFCSSNIVKKYEPINKNKYYIIYNGIDCFEIDNELKDNEIKICFNFNLQSLENKFIIGTVGSLVPYKGHDILIKAINDLRHKIENLICLIVGKEYDKNWKNELENLIKKFNLNDKILFTGAIYPPYEIMKLFNIFILTSHNEGLPRVLLEAMCLKKPIIASNVGGVSELVINNFNGYLFNDNDWKELSNLIYKLYISKDLLKFLGENGYKYVKEKFSIKSMVEKTQEVYYNLLDRRNYYES